uniref:Uncharacterized protein n=1 Tax=Cucumis melo TaxID=3656 RepID=A0A9I9EJ22_CUCME
MTQFDLLIIEREKIKYGGGQDFFILGQIWAKFFLALSCVLALAVFGFGNGYEKKGEIGIFELKRGDFLVKYTNWGATIMSLLVPDKHGLSPFCPFSLGFLSHKTSYKSSLSINQLIFLTSETNLIQHVFYKAHQELHSERGKKSIRAGVGRITFIQNLDTLPSRSLLRNFYKALSLLQQPLEQFLNHHHLTPTCIISDKYLY